MSAFEVSKVGAFNERKISKDQWKAGYSNLRAQEFCGNPIAYDLRQIFKPAHKYKWHSIERCGSFGAFRINNGREEFPF